MNKVAMAIEELHRSESKLASDLMRMADRHKADHEIFHVARDLAVWSQDHVRLLAAIGRDYGLELDPEPDGDPSVLASLRQELSDRMGRGSAPALMLLRDLRDVYMDASGVAVDWEILGQAAQGIKDTELHELSTRCRPDTLRQAKWANAMIKEAAPQILGS
jgi:hypothetical protein